MRKIICMIVGIMFLLLLTASFAASQSLDGLWFKLNVSGRGFIFDTLAHEYTSSNFKVVAYMNLEWDSVNLYYDLRMFNYHSGSWHYSNNIVEFPAGSEELLAPGHMGVIDENLNAWGLYFPTRFKIKRDKLGNVISASLNDLGCLVDNSDYPTNPTYEFYGSCKVRGKTVTKLPFFVP